MSKRDYIFAKAERGFEEIEKGLPSALRPAGRMVATGVPMSRMSIAQTFGTSPDAAARVAAHASGRKAARTIARGQAAKSRALVNEGVVFRRGIHGLD